MLPRDERDETHALRDTKIQKIIPFTTKFLKVSRSWINFSELTVEQPFSCSVLLTLRGGAQSIRPNSKSGEMRLAILISLASAWGAVQGSAVHCQPGDPGCAKCQASCDTIELGALPECCEVYSACCPTYSNQCRSCEANMAVDPHFPEYCCASFTDCCHLVPGLALTPNFSAKQRADSSSKKERQLSSEPSAALAASSHTSQFRDEVAPSSTTLHPTSISTGTHDVAAQSSRPAGRGTLAEVAHPPATAAQPPTAQPRTRQRQAVAGPSARSVRPTPAARQVAEAVNNRRGRVTSRGRVVQ
ncbi:hypothetical protein FHG87_001618 [Trinorchestia longiramus]|nr:hypothetical protein FHG87_001618 [Trinorchestia longiramus]